MKLYTLYLDLEGVALSELWGLRILLRYVHTYIYKHKNIYVYIYTHVYMNAHIYMFQYT